MPAFVVTSWVKVNFAHTCKSHMTSHVPDLCQLRQPKQTGGIYFFLSFDRVEFAVLSLASVA